MNKILVKHKPPVYMSKSIKHACKWQRDTLARELKSFRKAPVDEGYNFRVGYITGLRHSLDMTYFEMFKMEHRV